MPWGTENNKMSPHILTEPSLSKDNLMLFLLTQLVGFAGMPVYTFAASLKFSSGWFDLVEPKLTIKYAWPWFMTLMWFLYHESVALGLFFLMKDFVDTPGVHHPGDYGFSVGWLLGGIGAGILYPLAATAFTNMFPAALCMWGALAGVAISFGLQMQYTQQTAPIHLHIDDPSPWLLLFPICWLIYNSLIAADLAVISSKDADYLAKAAESLRIISSKKRESDPSNVVDNLKEVLLVPNQDRDTTPPTTVQTVLNASLNTTSNRHPHRSQVQPHSGSHIIYDG